MPKKPAKKTTAKSGRSRAGTTRRKSAARKKPTLFQKLARSKSFVVAAFVIAFVAAGAASIMLVNALGAGPIKGIAGKCLDNDHGILQDKNKVQLYKCNNTNAQKWTVGKNGVIHLADGYCLDVKYAGKKVGTPVWLYTCNGTVAQKWKVNKDGSIVNPNSGLCLDDQWSKTADGNPIWIYTCNHTKAQKWQIPAPVDTPAIPAPAPAPAPGSNGGGGKQPTGSGIKPIQNLSGATFSQKVNAAGSGALVSLQPKTYTFSDFKDGQQSIARQNSAYGAWLKAKGLLGAGSKYTVIQMNPHTSKKAGDVPSSNCGGGTGCPTNNLYLLRMDAANAKVDGVTLLGTAQGHFYNGLRFDHVANPTLSNSVIKSIPGNSSANPGETFAVNLQHDSGTATVSNVTIDGGGVGAGGLAANSTSGTINVNGLATTNLRYSAGIALWQQTGTVNLRNFSSINNARALGAERLGATVNIYDPNWGTPKVGHDITYTPYSGHKGRINLYFSSASKVPKRKILILTNTKSVKSTVHVYVGGKEQSASKYIGWQGA